MCGRFGLIAPRHLAEGGLLDALRLDEVGPAVPATLAPRYNVAPSMDVLVALAHRGGLSPSDAPDARLGARLCNARGERVARTPAFASAWRRGRRCLILADLFYEWQHTGDGDAPASASKGGRSARVPWAFAMADDAPFAMGGLWESWRDPADPTAPPVVSCTVLTTAPNALVGEVHDRMPVIVPASAYDAWLSRETPPSDAQGLVAPYPAMLMRRWRVSSRVNDPRHDDPGVVAPLPDDRPA